jgi:hypothetical protein
MSENVAGVENGRMEDVEDEVLLLGLAFRFKDTDPDAFIFSKIVNSSLTLIIQSTAKDETQLNDMSALCLIFTPFKDFPLSDQTSVSETL